MELGTVKFFLTAADKLFGFIEDQTGKDVFFHYSGGRAARLYESQTSGYRSLDLHQPEKPLRYPRKGDKIMFDRSNKAKGPKAAVWCFKSDYDDACNKAKRNLTLTEAKELMSDAEATGLEYTKSSTSYGTTRTRETATIRWRKADSQTVATGEFEIIWEKGSERSPERILSTMAVVEVLAPDKKVFHNTRFQLHEAEVLRLLGRNRNIQTGVYTSVMWNGGSDYYVVDPTSVRDMTEEEIAKCNNSPFPSIGNEWLRCTFAQQFGLENQAVKVIAHLGGHD